MSEGYVKTSAADVNDLLNQIVSQAVVHGWTQNFIGAHQLVGRRAHISKDGTAVNLLSNMAANSSTGGTTNANIVIPAARREGNYSWNFGNASNGYVNPDVLALNVGVGYNSAAEWYAQPSADITAPDSTQHVFRAIRAKGAIGNVYMFFFENPAAFFVVCEVRPGEFYWLTAGNIRKDYEFEGGQFYGASLAATGLGNGYPAGGNGLDIRVIHPQAGMARGNGWGGVIPSPETGYSISGSTNAASNDSIPAYWTRVNWANTAFDDIPPELQRGYDPSTGQLWLSPIRAFVRRVGGGNSYVGAVPHIFYVTTSHFTGAEIVTVGGEEYMIFPCNWRSAPYDWDVTTVSYDTWGPWYRNNTRGSGFAIRKPS